MLFSPAENNAVGAALMKLLTIASVGDTTDEGRSPICDGCWAALEKKLRSLSHS